MHARVLTLRYSTALGGFDDSELQRLTAQHDLLEPREHVMSAAGEPCMVLIATLQERPTPVETTATNTSSPAQADVRRMSSRKAIADVLQGLDDAQRAQFESIRGWRASTAHEEGVPPYVILTNRQLVEVVKQRPYSRAALGKIGGLGNKKLAGFT